MRRMLAILVGLALVPASHLVAQNPPAPPSQPATAGAKTGQNLAYRFRLLGVYDDATGDPIEGVEVADILNGNKSLTTSTGTVSLMFLPEGGSLIRLRKVGYAPQTLTVAISPADTAPVTITLNRATELPTVVVRDSAPTHLSPRMSTFEEHRKQGLGQFITEEELRKNESRSLPNLLASKLAGMQATPGKTSSTYLTSTRKMCMGRALSGCSHPNCYVRVFTDGTLTYDTSMGLQSLPDFARLNISDYGAVEFYPGGAVLPAGISPLNSDCGTLLLYTRER